MAQVSMTVFAKDLGMSRQALHKHIKQGHIKSVHKVGSFYVFDEDEARKELEEYLKRPNQKYKGRRKRKKPSEDLQEPMIKSNDEVASPGE